MEPSFWHSRWQTNNIAFHQPEVNPLLVRHFPTLALPAGARVFVPLCGKSLDLPWLVSQGCRVAGVELSPLAVEQFFFELDVTPVVSVQGALRHYQAPSVDLYTGDLFELTPEILGPVDAIYDRAALVALPLELRRRYTAQLLKLGGGAPQLLATYVYDQSQAEGPPFAVGGAEVADHYQGRYRITRLSSETVEGGMRGKTPAQEEVWLLQRP
ncbi:MAG TPA: thiopurine S-methyltransferase [bacterium]|nr:thiopurine S-methyltransferase [bacterium]